MDDHHGHSIHLHYIKPFSSALVRNSCWWRLWWSELTSQLLQKYEEETAVSRCFFILKKHPSWKRLNQRMRSLFYRVEMLSCSILSPSETTFCTIPWKQLVIQGLCLCFLGTYTMLNSILSQKFIVRFCSLCFSVGGDSIAVLGSPVMENKGQGQKSQGLVGQGALEKQKQVKDFKNPLQKYVTQASFISRKKQADQVYLCRLYCPDSGFELGGSWAKLHHGRERYLEKVLFLS